MANILAGLYEKDEFFIAFCKQCSLVRQRWVLSKYVKFMPPSQRNKLRFANIFGIVLWAKKHLANWDKLPEEVKIGLSFLQDNTLFLNKKHKNI